ncbi:hypoxanthine phosphoribosyltransferase [Candidatus Woesearchaeota archaeon]|nr:hypoxanthine phosphoribosyltransferase [Candidatus Woesearchaeota archaeon]
MAKIMPLISRKRISARVSELVKEISHDFPKHIFCIFVLTGAVIFFSDLLRELKKKNIEIRFSAVKLSSYKGKKSSGKVTMALDADDVKGKDILIVEDIIDTGITLEFLRKHLLKKGARTVRICTLLDKKERRKVAIEADYVGFSVPDKFVVGYGLDYNGRYRDLDHVGYIQ